MDRIDGDLTAGAGKASADSSSRRRATCRRWSTIFSIWPKSRRARFASARSGLKCMSCSARSKACSSLFLPITASVDLTFEDATDISPLHTDEGKVSQILRNLISNALKFTPHGSVTVSAQMLPDQRVQFSVADTGIGIPPSITKRSSKSSARLKIRCRKSIAGRGSVLPLCRNLAMLLGGHITLESELGRGSTFLLTIPMVYVGEPFHADSTESIPAPEFHRAPGFVSGRR